MTRCELLTLFYQAIACYTPKFLWGAFEGNLMQTLSMGLQLGICSKEEKAAKTGIILKYLNTHRHVSILQMFIPESGEYD